MVDNLIRLHGEATAADGEAGAMWYPNAHKIVCEWANTFSLPIATVAAVVAAISPQVEWSRNLIIADDILSERPPSIGGALHLNLRKAERIRRERITDTRVCFASGPKVHNFSLNLAGNFSVVTVDAHAAQAALDDPTFSAGLKPTTYTLIAECYQTAARTLGCEPATLQAILWLTWKRLYPAAEKRALQRGR